MVQHTIRVLEQNLPVNTTRSDQGRIKGIDLVGGHDDLDVTTIIETVQLVEKLQHGSLDFSLTTRCRIVTLRTNGIDFVNKDNRGCVLASNLTMLAKVEFFNGSRIPGKAVEQVEVRHRDTSE